MGGRLVRIESSAMTASQAEKGERRSRTVSSCLPDMEISAAP
jgi:hypothetical protein